MQAEFTVQKKTFASASFQPSTAAAVFGALAYRNHGLDAAQTVR
jgi:hypothetical protein